MKTHIIKKTVQFDPLKKGWLIFFGSTVWPQYKSEDQESWSESVTLNYNMILQLFLLWTQ